MSENGLKMAALESIPDPENKIPGFIQGFLTYDDFLEFFVDHFDGNITPFERTLKEIDLFYSMSMRNKGDDNIKVASKNDKFYVVLRKMIDYRIGMIPIVQDMQSKKVIGLFFLKDVFWLLRSDKYFDKPIHVLLKAIYQETLNDDYEGSDYEEDEESEGENTYGDLEFEDDEKDFLEKLDEGSKNSASGSINGRIRSFNIDESHRSVPHNDILNASSQRKVVSSD